MYYGKFIRIGLGALKGDWWLIPCCLTGYRVRAGI